MAKTNSFTIFTNNLVTNHKKLIITNHKFNKMKTLLEQITAEVYAFETNANAQATKSNKAAGARARKEALNISKLMKDFRKASLEASKR